MKIKLQSSIFVSVFLLLLFIGCRQDVILQNEDKFDANTAKFQAVQLKDIPKVTKYIRNKTGRTDLKIPLKSKFSNSALAKGNIDFGNLESSIIIKKIEDENTNYYIFNLENTGDEKTIYNFEVKEVGGDIVDAKVLEYLSDVPYEDDPFGVLRNFAGIVTAYSLEGDIIASLDFTNGQNPCPPDPNNPPSGGGGSGGGIYFPPEGGYPNNPGFPSWPGSGGGSSGGGGGSNGGNEGGGSGCDSNVWTFSHHVTIDGELFWMYTNCKGQTKKVLAIEANLKNSTSKVTAPCDDGSGVILLPGGNPKNEMPCEKIKKLHEEEKFKEKVAAIDKAEVFNYDHEMGYAAGYPPPNTGVTGTQYPPMENVIGTHNLSLPSGDHYFGFIHSHTNDDGDKIRIKIFSPGDLWNFLMRCVQGANQYGTISDAYAMVITSQGNYMLKYTGTNINFGIGTGTMKWWNKWYLDDMNAIRNDDGTFDQLKVEKAFLKFLKNRVKIDGVELYSLEKVTGTAKRLSLDADNNINPPTACP